MTKKEMTEKCNRILNSNIGKTVPFDDFKFLMSVFVHHPEWKEKTKGLEIIGIKVACAQKYTKCFYLIRENGTETDISYYACIKGKPTQKNEITAACRDAIDKSVISPFRYSLEFPIICPIHGSLLNSLEDVHVDHYNKTFKEVVASWIKKNGGEKELMKYIDNEGENNTITCFNSEEIKQNFIQYHNENTHLRAVSKKANLSTLKESKKQSH